MLFYESAKCLHGRMNEFKGKYYGSIFLHYNPVDKDIWNYKHDVSTGVRDYSEFLNGFHLIAPVYFLVFFLFYSRWFCFLIIFLFNFFLFLLILFFLILFLFSHYYLGCDCRCPPTLVWRYHRDSWIEMGWSGKYIRTMKRISFFLRCIFDFLLYSVTFSFNLVALLPRSAFCSESFLSNFHLFFIIFYSYFSFPQALTIDSRVAAGAPKRAHKSNEL